MSPNIKEAQRLLAANPDIGFAELDERSRVTPRVMSWAQYCERRRTFGEMEQKILLDAEFWKGRETRLFTDAWLDNAARLAKELAEGLQWGKHGIRYCLGVDPAEGGDNSAWSVVNSMGLHKLVSRKTGNTAKIPGETAALMREHNVAPEDCGFDRGGGGKIHADNMREDSGLNVRTVAFGDPPMADPRRGHTPHGLKVDIKEERYAFVNLRAQMYHELALDENFAIPAEILDRPRDSGGHSLRFQMSKIPRLLDKHGRYWLPSKGNLTEQMEQQGIKTLIQIIGASPDELDSLVIAYHILKHPQRRMQAGAA